VGRVIGCKRDQYGNLIGRPNSISKSSNKWWEGKLESIVSPPTSDDTLASCLLSPFCFWITAVRLFLCNTNHDDWMEEMLTPCPPSFSTLFLSSSCQIQVFLIKWIDQIQEFLFFFFSWKSLARTALKSYSCFTKMIFCQLCHLRILPSFCLYQVIIVTAMEMEMSDEIIEKVGYFKSYIDSLVLSIAIVSCWLQALCFWHAVVWGGKNSKWITTKSFYNLVSKDFVSTTWGMSQGIRIGFKLKRGRMYQVQFTDGTVQDYAANYIAKVIYSSVDYEGNK